ncbi:MAG: hypothetical protein NVSMB64_29740 [Candidatus Velthaea sp.]
MRNAIDDGNCFACGPFNEDGLKLRFVRDGADGARADVTVDPKFQGYRGIAHGGIVMMLLDEAMAHASGMVGEKAMTASVNVRFRRPVPTGEPLMLRGKVLWQRGRVLSIEGAVLDAGGEVLASAEGSFVTQGRIEPGSLSNLTAGETV